MEGDRTALVFVYGTLKRGFPNYSLLDDLIRDGDATFVAAGRTASPFPLVVGPLSIPFLIRLPGSGRRVYGEIYTLSPRGLVRVDDLEGTHRGHYERLTLAVVPVTSGRDGAEADNEEAAAAAGAVEAEAYFAHRTYAEDMWRRNGERGLGSYSEEDAREYVRPEDRLPDTTFLGEVRRFLASPS
ncbi:Gamma-glutamylcyclotransferase [Musa troglodytarum]|uniref:Gamma-glutamylcyclotransferase family protein n=1 Tax=Musa troglodytarum TaxID=320322 RepID=A0A9E7FFX4_9LILI|nr:Gamma-glutamylcyclotransferase [Musa troglodytarum]